MEIKTIYGNVTQIQADVTVLHYFEGSDDITGDINEVDKALEGIIKQLIDRGEIKGKFKEITSIYTYGKIRSPKVIILGLGKKSEFNLEKIRLSTAEVCKILRQKSSEIVAFSVQCIVSSGIDAANAGQAITEGAMLGVYTFRKHMTQPSELKEIQQINIISSNSNMINELEQGCQKGKIIAEATILARDMGNEPANYMTPTMMVEIARRIAQQQNINIQVIEQDEMAELGMGGLLGVAQGSLQPPKLIILNYRGKDTRDIDIALIGKGITFDSGGISIKPSEGMGEMKGDMAGGASVIAVLNAISQLKPLINVTAIIPATENLPSGSAMRPGDVITIMNGKTVEIISTDAEGRLILADGLCYAQKLGARRLVDVATLTGACHIALGDYCTGTFGNNQEFIDQIIAAGAEAGECLWQMPMNQEYKDQNKSDVADIKNTGGRYGGAITAAWFLREFINNTPWLHLDIAGTSTTDKDRGYLIKGNTGIPVRTLINLILSLAKK